MHSPLSKPAAAPQHNVQSDDYSTVSHPSDEVKDPNREGGLRSIIALLGSFCALFCTVGFINAFGVFQEYYESHQLSSHSAFDISWLGSFQTFLLFISAAPAGFLVDRSGPFLPMVFGSIAILLGIFMTSLCKQYWEFFLAQALLMGIGYGFVLSPAVAVTPKYFRKHRALAMGVTIAGSSMGGIIWPIMLDNLLNKTTIGFGWSIRIVGFVMLPLLACVCFAVRSPVVVSQPAVLAVDTEKAAPAKGDVQQKPPKTALLKNPNFILLCAGLGMIYLGFFGPFFYISTYAVSLGESSSFSFYLISILNAASLVGRILPGAVADIYGTWNLLMISALLSAIVCFCWTAATSVAGIVVWSLAYGFASGAILSLQAASATSLVDPKDSGKAIGMVLASVSLTGLFSAPIVGQLVEHYGYLAVSMYTGSVLVAGGLIITLARFRLQPKLLAVV